MGRHRSNGHHENTDPLAPAEPAPEGESHRSPPRGARQLERAIHAARAQPPEIGSYMLRTIISAIEIAQFREGHGTVSVVLSDLQGASDSVTGVYSISEGERESLISHAHEMLVHTGGNHRSAREAADPLAPADPVDLPVEGRTR